MKWWVLTLAILTVYSTAGVCHESVDWLTKFDWAGKDYYQKKLIIPEVNGQGEFEVTLASADNKLLVLIDVTNIEIEILPPEEFPMWEEREGAGVYIDGVFIGHPDEANHESVIQLPKPPSLLMKIHYLGDNEPARFMVRKKNFPEQTQSTLVNAGHYKSLVCRRSGSGSSYVKFYHHHGDWNLHVLYEGWFSRCSYAYDCYPNHSIPEHWTSRRDEGTEYRGDCYGRCP